MELKTLAIDGYRIGLGFEDEEPRVLDLELAKHLGYERPRAIRELIERLARDGKLNDFELCRTVRQSGGRPATEYWLTQAQALKVVAKSETAKADAILDEVIRVFLSVTRLLRPQGAASLVDGLARLEARMDTLQANQAALWGHISQGGYIARARFEALRAEWQDLADLEVAVGRWDSRRAALADIQRDMREATEWGGKGKAWSEMPAALEPAARAVLKRRRKEALRRSPRPQLTLPRVEH